MSQEDVLELAAQRQLKVQEIQSDIFTSYCNHQIFFIWHVESEEWFFLIHQPDEDSITGYPTRAANCFNTWNDGINWAMQVVNCLNKN